MLNQVWINAWFVSFISSIGIFIILIKNNNNYFDSILLSSIGFFSPIFLFTDNANSMIFLVDIFGPLIMLRVVFSWRQLPKDLKIFFILLLLVYGLIPLFTALLSTGKFVILAHWYINAYRCLYAVAIGALAFIAREKGISHSSLTLAVCWAVLILCAATIMQGLSKFDSNVFYNLLKKEALYNQEVNWVAVGTFRGSAGIIGSLGFVCMLYSSDRSLQSAVLRWMGGIAGIVLCLATGSKTSVVTIIIVSVVYMILIRKINLKMLFLIFIVVISTGWALTFIQSHKATQTLRVFNLFQGKKDSLRTYYGREKLRNQAMQYVSDNPEILVGLPGEATERYWGGALHNDYLELLFRSGILGPIALTFAIFTALSNYAKSVTSNDGVGKLGILVCSVGLLQGLSVNHFFPGVYFPVSTSILAFLYGLSFVDYSKKQTI